MQSDDLSAGTIVAGRFVVETLAGRGGMGTVHRARDNQTGRPVALKILRGSTHADLERFAREATALASVDHPAIVRPVAHGTTETGAAFMAMDWVEGEELGKLLRRRALTVDEAVGIVRCAAEALAAAHARGIVHRDVKPNNLLVDASGRVTLVDFGVALLVKKTQRLTRRGDVIGTPAYMSPEQARGELEIDARSDVFSLGCVLHKCLTGHSPFGGGDMLAVLTKILLQDPPPPSASVDGVSPAIDALVARMLEKEPARRPASGREVVEAIDEALAATTRGSAVSRRIGDEERSVFTVVLIGEARGPFEVLTSIAARHEARIERLQDGELVVTPLSTGTIMDRVRRAARTAIELREQLDTAMALVIGLGTTSGAAPTGEVIERGAQLLRAAEASDRRAISIDDDTAAMLESDFEIARDGDALYLLGERAPFESTRTVLGRTTPLLGRARELTFLEHTVRASVEDLFAQWVWIVAGPGLGKTRTTYELLRRMARSADAIEILAVSADPASASSPYAFVAKLIGRAAWLRPDEPIERKRHKLTVRLGRYLPPDGVASVGTFLGELVGLGSEDTLPLVAARRNPALMSAGIARAFETWLSAETASLPLLLVVDDAHFVDAASHALLAAAATALRHRPLIVLALARREASDRFGSVDGASMIALPPLGAVTATTLVNEFLGVERTAAERIVEAANGNPLHLEELVRAHARGGSATNVVTAMHDRIDALSGAARRVLRAVSVFGVAAPIAGVSAILAESADTLGSPLEELFAAEVLARASVRFGADGDLGFVQTALRDAAYATLTEDDRRIAHQLAGEFLAEHGEGDLDVLAGHFALAGNAAREGSFSARSAELAYARNDLEGARVRAERAFELDVDGAKMLTLLADVHRLRGRLPDAYEAAVSASTRAAHATVEWCEALAARATIAGLLGKYDEPAVIVDELLSVRPARDEERRARRHALCRAALALLPSGRLAAVDRALEELARDPPRLLDDPVIFARFAGLRGSRAAYAGDTAEYLRASELSVGAFEQAGDARGACIQRVHVGYAALSIGDYGTAERVLRAAASEARALGLPNIVASALQNLGVSLVRAGNGAEGVALLRETIPVFEGQGDVAMLAATKLYLAEALATAGRNDEAEQTIAEALNEGDVASLRSPLLAWRARLLIARGATDRAASTAREAARALSEVEGVEEGESLIRLALAEALIAARDPSSAEAVMDAVERVRARADAIRDPYLRDCFLAIRENARTLSLARM